MKFKVLMAFALLALAAVDAMAVSLDMKPGLWQHSFKLDSSSLNAAQKEQQQQAQQAMAEINKNLAEMPPEQRKQLEAIMAKNGVALDIETLTGGGKVQLTKDATLVKECITQAQIDKGELPTPEKNCKNTLVQKSSNVFKVSYKCAGSSGTAEVTFQNPKAYTGKTTYTQEGVDSKNVIQGDMSGKWLSNDCGTIKPAAEQEQDYDAEPQE